MDGRTRERAGKAALAALLQERSTMFAPGRWRVLDTRTAVLQETAVPGRTVLGHIERRRGIKAALVGVRRLLAQPRVVHLGSPERGGPPDPSDLIRVLVTKDGGLVAFDRAGSHVMHLRRAPFPSEYRTRRRALGEVYPSVEWTLSDDERTLTEARVDGRPARDWAPEERLALVRTLFGIASAQVIAGEQSLPAVEQGALDSLSGEPRWAAVARAASLVGSLPWVLAHGDLTPENIIGRGPDDWAPIDFEDARPAPFFYDALSVVARNSMLRAAFLEGALSNEWRGLLSSAHVDESILTPEIAVDLVAFIAADHHRREHGGDFSYTLSSLAPPSPR